jgi:hypothetical protein
MGGRWLVGELVGRRERVAAAWTRALEWHAGLFCVFGHGLLRSFSEFERTSALRAGARRLEGWIEAGGALRRSGAVIAAAPWQGRGQAWTEKQLAVG